jgi:hypothetical protein
MSGVLKFHETVVVQAFCSGSSALVCICVTAGKFVAKRIRPALQRAREKELPELLSESGAYLKGLWSRLNGTAGRSRKALPAELKLPAGSQKDVDKVCWVCGRQQQQWMRSCLLLQEPLACTMFIAARHELRLDCVLSGLRPLRG